MPGSPRATMWNIGAILAAAVADAGVGFDGIDAVATTAGPGARGRSWWG